PKIEAADAVGLEGLGQLDAAFENFVLLLEREIGVKLGAFRAEFGFRCAGPVHFEERAGDVRHAQFVFFEDAARLVDFFGVKTKQVFVPHAAQLDPLKAKLARNHFARTAEVLAHFIVDDSNMEWRGHTVSPSFSSTYFLLMTADSLGVRALSGTASSSTIPHPRKFILRSAASTAGRSTEPRPSSTKR